SNRLTLSPRGRGLWLDERTGIESSNPLPSRERGCGSMKGPESNRLTPSPPGGGVWVRERDGNQTVKPFPPAGEGGPPCGPELPTSSRPPGAGAYWRRAEPALSSAGAGRVRGLGVRCRIYETTYLDKLEMVRSARMEIPRPKW